MMLSYTKFCWSRIEHNDCSNPERCSSNVKTDVGKDYSTSFFHLYSIHMFVHHIAFCIYNQANTYCNNSFVIIVFQFNLTQYSSRDSFLHVCKICSSPTVLNSNHINVNIIYYVSLHICMFLCSFFGKWSVRVSTTCVPIACLKYMCKVNWIEAELSYLSSFSSFSGTLAKK